MLGSLASPSAVHVSEIVLRSLAPIDNARGLLGLALQAGTDPILQTGQLALDFFPVRGKANRFVNQQ